MTVWLQLSKCVWPVCDQGLLLLIYYGLLKGPRTRAPPLGPRPFSISVVNSFGDNFVWMYISTHAPISSSTEPSLLLSGANYWAHRFRLRQQSDASSHSFDSTLGKLHFEFRDKSHDNLLKIVDGSAKLWVNRLKRHLKSDASSC